MVPADNASGSAGHVGLLERYNRVPTAEFFNGIRQVQKFRLWSLIHTCGRLVSL
jgi:hypothetical protein